MAISKIKPIKKTLKKAIDYIIDEEKTDGGKLVSSFSCSPMTADIEMQMTTDKARNKSERIAYHLMQSFSPEDDITPEKAHELGQEFADQLLGGKYEYVIATHIDKGHIHNHIIFNATSFIDYKKYHMPYWHKYKMFNINDRICRDNNLSVIENSSGKKGHTWYESKTGDRKIAWETKLKAAIDKAIFEARDYEDFINIMEMEGYEYKETNKNIAFRAASEGQNTFTRVNEKNYGEFYTKEMLKKRISDKDFDRSLDKGKNKKRNEERNEEKENQNKTENRNRKTTKKPRQNGEKINLMIDISKNIKAQQSKGYEHALVMANINTMVKTMNYLNQYGITTLEELNAKADEAASLMQTLESNMKELEKDRKALSEKIKFSQNYVKYKKVAAQAKREPVGSEFLKEHKDEILLFNVAALYMEKNKIDTTYLDIRKMIEEHKEYIEKKKMLNPELKKMKERVQELEAVKQNTMQILNVETAEKAEEAKIEKAEKDIEK